MRPRASARGLIRASIRDSSNASVAITTAGRRRAYRVRIETTWQGAGGLGGLMERLFAPRVLRNLYADELARLDAYAREQALA